MSKVEELKKKLAQAELDEKNSCIKTIIEEHSKEVGKIYSTHIFRRQAKTIHAQVIKIIGAGYDDNYRHYYVIEKMVIRKYDKHFSFISSTEKNRAGDGSMPFNAKPMSEERYNSVRNWAMGHLDTITTNVLDSLPVSEMSNGHEVDEIRREDLIDPSIPQIYLKNNPELVKVLLDYKFPYLIGNTLLVEHSLPVLEKVKDTIIAHRSIWAHCWESDTSSINKIDRIIKLVENARV